MSDKDVIPGEGTAQDAPPIVFGADALRKFLDAVFHVELMPDEHIMTWAVMGKPGYPTDSEHLLNHTLRRSKQPKALYYGTSTASPDPDDGKLYNRRALCKRTFVIVLDDIGTKIPLDKLSEDLQDPTYIIESSAGNFQYGYVLDEPITDVESATVLVQLLYEAGISDAGGAMANKLVRLPDGINGKAGARGEFRVRLETLDPANLWTPDELLTAAGVEVTWAEVQEQGRKSLQRRKATTVTRWSDTVTLSPNLDGTLDPALEWLYEAGHVKQETGDWVTVRCPWEHEHTTGDAAAGYSPLGRGDTPFDAQRGFKCFHEHCKDRNAAEFLKWIQDQGGPELPVKDATTPLHLNWTYDPVEDLAYPINVPGTPCVGIKLTVLKRYYPARVAIQSQDGVKMVSVVDLWVKAPNRVAVYGQMPHPAVDAPLCRHNGSLMINTFTPPAYARDEATYDADVAKFTDFINYLIPDEKERTFLLDWLAAKVRDQAFRGPAILMVTPTQGTGRTTFGAMVSTLLGTRNTASLSYDQLTGSSTFNEWQLSTLCICNEVFEGRTGANTSNFYRGYERLKGLVDFQPVSVAINRKNRAMRDYMVFTSFLMFSNHADALPLTEADRRIYVIGNTRVPRDGVYFNALNAWLEQGTWTGNVGHWLCAREVDVPALLAPPEMSETKRTMILDSRTDLDRVIDALLTVWKGPYISDRVVRTLLDHGVGLSLGTRINCEPSPRSRHMVTRALNRVAVRPPAQHRQRMRMGHSDWQGEAHSMMVLKSAPDELIEAATYGQLNPTTCSDCIAANRLDEVYEAMLAELEA